MRALKEDDQKILWDGINSLNLQELREACQERGMRSTGLSKSGYRGMLEGWLELSVSKNIPISLLIMSRTFFLKDEIDTKATRVSKEDSEKKSISGLADAISGLDSEVLNEVLLEVATPSEARSNPDVLKVKMEVLESQNERIQEEYEARKAAAERESEKKKKEKKMGKALEKEERKEKIGGAGARVGEEGEIAEEVVIGELEAVKVVEKAEKDAMIATGDKKVVVEALNIVETLEVGDGKMEQEKVEDVVDKIIAEVEEEVKESLEAKDVEAAEAKDEDEVESDVESEEEDEEERGKFIDTACLRSGLAKIIRRLAMSV